MNEKVMESPGSNNFFKALMSTIKNNFVKNQVEFLFWNFNSNQIRSISDYKEIFEQSEILPEWDMNFFVKKYIHHNDLEKILHTMDDLKKDVAKNSALFRVVVENNKILHIRASFEKIHNENMNTIGVLILAMDCTNELKEMKEIQYKRLRNELIYTMNMMSVENLPEIIRMFLENALIITESKFGCMYHFDRDENEFISFNCTNRFLPSEEEEEDNTAIENCINDAAFVAEVLKQKDVLIHNEGTDYIPFEYKATTIAHEPLLNRFILIPMFIMEEPVGVLVLTNKEENYTNSDARSVKSLMEEVYRVIQLKQNEKVASVNREKFQQTFEKAPIGICFISLEGNFISVNHKYCEILGYSESKLMKMNFADVTYEEDLAENLRLHNALKNDLVQEYSYEKRYIKEDQTVIWVKVTSTKVKEAFSKDIYIISVAEDINDRKMSQQKLKLNEAKLKEAERISKSGYWEYDVLENKYYLSEGIERLIKEDKMVLNDQLITDKNKMVIFAGFADHMLKMPFVKNKKRAFKETYEVATIQGKTKYFELTALPEYSEDKIVFLRGFIKNITAEKLVEEKLLKNEMLYQTVIENLPYKFVIKDTSLNYIAANSRFANSLNLTKEELQGKNDFDFFSKELADQYKKDDLRILENKKTEDLDIKHYNGTQTNWENIIKTAVLDPSGDTIALVAMVKDITERKANDDELEQYRTRLEVLVDAKTKEVTRIEEELSLFFDTTLDMLCISNFEGYLTKVSTTWTKTLGWTENELLTHPIMYYVHPEDHAATHKIFNDLVLGTNVLNFTNRFRCKDGTYKWVDWNSTAILERKLIIAAARDITKQKEIEHALIEAKQKAELAFTAKSEFLANISHEIRTPLNSVIGYAELLEGHLKNPSYINYVKGISSSGRILLSLINDILDLSKLEASKMTLKYEWVNIRDFMDHIEKVFILNAKNKQIDFLIEMDTDFPRYVFMDEIRVRQVLINLIGNAIKFTHEGYVKLKISYHNDTQEVGKNDLIFMVEDTGIGIADDNLEEIFNAFTQQKSLNMIHYGGTGLGLAICKKTLDIMNGEIFVSSQVGKGSTFEVKLKDIALNNLKNVSMHPIDIDVTVILEAFQTDKKFKKHMVSLLVQSKNALKMNLIKQISTELIEFGVKSSHEPIIELGTHLKKSIEEIDLEQCNRIVNQLKRVLIPVEERHD